MHFALGILIVIGVVALVVAAAVMGIVSIRRQSGRRGRSGSLGAAFLEVESLFVESKRRSVEALRAEEREADPGAGDPPRK